MLSIVYILFSLVYRLIASDAKSFGTCTKIDLFPPSNNSSNAAILACDVTHDVSKHRVFTLLMC